LDISLKKSGLTAELTSLITGSGKLIRKPAEARERLTSENHTKEIRL
jgi:hypothetical protein